MRASAAWWGLVLLAAPLAAQTRELIERTLTLDDCVKIALRNSQPLMNAAEDRTIALQRVQQAESQFYPKLDLNANWSKFGIDGDTPLMLQPALSPTLVPNSPRENYYTFRANILQTVYEGGRVRNTWKQARIAYEQARDLYDSMTTQVAGAAKQAFYDLRLAEERHRVYEEALLQARRLPSGGSPLERLRAEHWKSFLRARQAALLREEMRSRLALVRALNLEMGTTIEVVGDFATQPQELALSKMLAWASRYRSELRQQQYQQESDALGIRLSLAERNPTVALGATYERTGYDINLETVNWAGTLNINLPLSVSDMIFGWAKVKERKAQYRQATLHHAETMDLIEKQVREAYADVRFWQDELPLRDEERRRLHALKGDVATARASGAEQLEALYLATESDARYFEAVHGHLWSLAALERATGRSLSEP